MRSVLRKYKSELPGSSVSSSSWHPSAVLLRPLWPLPPLSVLSHVGFEDYLSSSLPLGSSRLVVTWVIVLLFPLLHPEPPRLSPLCLPYSSSCSLFSLQQVPTSHSVSSFVSVTHIPRSSASSQLRWWTGSPIMMRWHLLNLAVAWTWLAGIGRLFHTLCVYLWVTIIMSCSPKGSSGRSSLICTRTPTISCYLSFWYVSEGWLAFPDNAHQSLPSLSSPFMLS